MRARNRNPIPHALLVMALATFVVPSALPSLALAAPRASIQAAPPSKNARQRHARKLLMDARMLEREGRLEAALRTTARGLAEAPNDAELHRLRARLLTSLGRDDQAASHRERALELDPPPPPLPGKAMAGRGEGVLLVLLAPPAAQQRIGRAPSDWPDGAVHRTLTQRLATRLPEAQLAAAPSGEDVTLAGLRAWLGRHAASTVVSLRVDRAYCGESIKDGRLGLAVLRTTLSRADADAPPTPGTVRYVRHDSELDADCQARKVARALELWLDEASGPISAARTQAPRVASDYSRESIHALFPELELRIQAALAEGRRRLATGQLDAAHAAFRRAGAIDGEHLDTRSFLAEVEQTLELSEQLSRQRETPPTEPLRPAEPSRAGGDQPISNPATADDWRNLEPRLSSAQLLALEAQLAAERRLRDDLLATLALMGDDLEAPAPETLARLRPGVIRDANARGPRRARAQLEQLQLQSGPGDAQRALTARVLYAPDGDLLARYYFVEGMDEPLLAEEDSTGNGRPDRWIAYAKGRRREVWEEDRGADIYDVHLVYAADGEMLERVELDTRRLGRPERVFVYREGLLRSEFHDTSGDGHFDEIQHFEVDGSLAMRERDLDRDGEIDVRTAYRDGRMVRREIMNPEVATELQ
jgi:tetratricopeptide (TPR) repeat protein